MNYTEHGESIGLNRLENTLNAKINANESFADGIVIDSDDEHSELAATLNTVIRKYENATQEIENGRIRFQQFAETASDWLWETDVDLRVNFIHAHSAHADGFQVNSILTRNLLDSLFVEASVLEQVCTCIAKRQAMPAFEASLKLNQNENQPYSVEVRALPNYSTDGEYLGYRGTITDISVRKAAEDKALFLATHDELTGLPNRRALAEHLKSGIREAQLNDTALVFAGVDLDGFKAVNDAYGHLVGDALLTQVAARLEAFLRAEDTAYRIGGDEFVVVLKTLNRHTAQRIARAITERLIAQISAQYFVQTIDLRIGASVGLSVYPDNSSDALDLLRMADLALYAAKDAGKGRVVQFEPELDSDAKLQLMLEQDLHKAINQKEFYLVYQPQIHVETEAVMGYEALIRWNHPERGEIPPGDFIAVAEKLNLMDKIGSFVLDEACEFAASWQADETGHTPTISVNVSPLQLKNSLFVENLVATLERHNLAPQRLEIEITEDVLVHDFAAVAALLTQLQTIGVSVAVDDFGSGQTSLRYLNQFPLSTIKINRSFIRHLASDPKAAEITRTIVTMGQKLGINVLAEGVEEPDQLSLLRQWNCNQIQGFLFARPMSSVAVKQSMLERANTAKLKKRA